MPVVQVNDTFRMYMCDNHMYVSLFSTKEMYIQRLLKQRVFDTYVMFFYSY